MKTTQKTGKTGENIAVQFLLKSGYEIVERNWRFLKSEIDIIAQKGEHIVFVEVKTRSSEEFGRPEDFISNKQQKLIVNAAHEYLVQNTIQLEARFDVISIVQMGNNVKLEHIPEAFYPTL